MVSDGFSPFTTNNQDSIDRKLQSVTVRSLPLDKRNWDINAAPGILQQQLEDLGVRAEGLREIKMTRGEVLRVNFPVNTLFLLIDPKIDSTKGYRVSYEAYEIGTDPSFSESIYLRSFKLAWINPLGVTFLMNDHTDSTRLFVTEGNLEVTPEIQNHFFPTLDKERTMEVVWERARRDLTASPPLVALWDLHGLHCDDLPVDCHVFVVKYDEEKIDHFRYLNQMTLSSVFPVSCKVISMKDIETTLEEYRGRKEFCVFIAEGTYVTDAQKFFYETYRQCYRLRREGQPLACHIMDFRGEGRTDRAPYMHEQFFIVNMEKFSELPSFRNFFSHGHVANFPNYEASQEQIHDHYTPHWLAPKAEADLQLKYEWGSEILNQVLRKGFRVENISLPLRDQKKFSYPNESDNFEQEQKVLAHRNARNLSSATRVFAFNVFDYDKHEIIDQPHQEVVSLASGFVPLLLFNQSRESLERFYFYDKNPTALQYWYDLIYSKCSYEELKQQVLAMAKYAYPTGGDVFIHQKLQAIINEHFEGDENSFLRTLHSMRERAEFHKLDILDSPTDLARLGGRDTRKLVWVSNIYSTHFLFQLYSQEEIHARYEKLMDSFVKDHEQLFASPTHTRFYAGPEEGNYRVLVTDDRLTFDRHLFQRRERKALETPTTSRIFI